MKIHALDPEPLDAVSYLNASPGGRGPEVRDLPITLARASGLPAGLDAVILAADLQGRERLPGAGRLGREGPRLLGEVAAVHLRQMCDAGLLPPAERTGVLLAGDLWAEPGCTKRGGLGDVAPAWQEFARQFRWAAGVLGNHDLLPSSPGAGCHVLDGRCVCLDGMWVGGVGGIIGRAGKVNRRPPEVFLDVLSRALAGGPAAVVLHAGPDAEGREGDASIREALEVYAPPLAVFGHCHWHDPLAQLVTGTQLANVDGRVIVAVSAGC